MPRVGAGSAASNRADRYLHRVLKHRIPVGAALIALALALAWLDTVLEGAIGAPGVALAAAAAPVLVLGAIELASMLRAKGARVTNALAVWSALSGLAIGSVAALAPNADRAGAVSLPLTALWIVGSLVAVARRKHTAGSLEAVAGAALILVLLGLIPASFLVLRQHESAGTIIALILVTKSSDIGAYFTGTTIGRRKLIPWLSPGKTWEGLAGGVVFAAAVATGLAGMSAAGFGVSALELPITPLLAAGLGGLLAVVGQAGDLTISLLKRDAGFKDSSGLLPGMGGVLDVIDSLLFVGPVAHAVLAVAA